VISFKPIQPFLLLSSDEMRFRLLRQLEEVLDVPSADLRLLSGLTEPLEGELPDRLQHGEALLCSCGSHQALVHQRGEAVEDVEGEISPVTHLLGGLKAPASGEDPEATEELLLVFGQKLVAPRDRTLERPLVLGPRGRGRLCP